MSFDMDRVRASIGDDEWDLVVDIRKTNQIWGVSGVTFETGTIHEIARKNEKKLDRDSLVAVAKGQEVGGFLVQICLEEFGEIEGGFEAGGVGYTENGIGYEGGSPAWLKWHAVRS